MPLSWLSFGHPLWSCVPSKTPLKETKFAFASGCQLELAAGLVGSGVLPPSALGSHLVQTQAGPVCHFSLSAFVWACWYRGPRFLGVLHPLRLSHSSTSSSAGFPEPRWEEIDGNILFGTECSKSLTLCGSSSYGSLICSHLLQEENVWWCQPAFLQHSEPPALVIPPS